MSWNEYDPESLTEKARRWRLVAASVRHETTRLFCLDQAERCDRRVQASIDTPVFRDMSEPAKLDDPAFASPLFARLVDTEDTKPFNPPQGDAGDPDDAG
jgi:hypothetical protein